MCPSNHARTADGLYLTSRPIFTNGGAETLKPILLQGRHGAAKDFRDFDFVKKRFKVVHGVLKQALLPENMRPFLCT